MKSENWSLSAVAKVFWITGDRFVPLAIVLCPHGGYDLWDDLTSMKEAGIQTLVSLLEEDEAAWLGLAEEATLAQKSGMEFLSHPIPDTRVPGNAAAFQQFVAGLARRLRNGEQIGVHCRGSIGRATVTAACTLIYMGWDSRTALAAIESARGCPVPDTAEQQDWILRYKATA